MSATHQLPLSYDAKQVLFDEFPEMKKFSKETDTCLEDIGRILSARELRGMDTSFARAALWEVRWRTKATSHLDRAQRAFDRLTKAFNDPSPPAVFEQDRDGSFGPGTRRWFLKLDRSTDQLLARQWPWRIAPYFLEKINDPVRMFTYLQGLTWCDVKRQGCDTRKELNLAFSVIARLVMRGGQAGYLAGPSFIGALERFVAQWQQPDSALFGVTYIGEDGTEITTRDLSLTFHVVRYVPHLVQNWERLVDSVFKMAGKPYPEGWLDEGAKMSNHNNYDVAEIFRRAWRFMRPDQRIAAAELLESMVDWCFADSVSCTGQVRDFDTGDMVPDAYYFAAAFLDTVGCFDRSKRFWTTHPFGDAKSIQTGMAERLSRFYPRLTVVADAMERLNLRHRANSNAIL